MYVCMYVYNYIYIYYDLYSQPGFSSNVSKIGPYGSGLDLRIFLFSARSCRDRLVVSSMN